MFKCGNVGSKGILDSGGSFSLLPGALFSTTTGNIWIREKHINKQRNAAFDKPVFATGRPSLTA
jgi:hypothetical protein